MKYEVRFSSVSIEERFDKALSKISQKETRLRIMEAVENLADQPRPEGKKFKAIRPPVYLYEFTAGYRLRIGDYRVLYDIDDEKRIVWILALRKRDEATYR